MDEGTERGRNGIIKRLELRTGVRARSLYAGAFIFLSLRLSTILYTALVPQ